MLTNSKDILLLLEKRLEERTQKAYKIYNTLQKIEFDKNLNFLPQYNLSLSVLNHINGEISAIHSAIFSIKNLGD